ncbi:Putative Ig domain-containing protein, partial [Thioclava dalianensis]
AYTFSVTATNSAGTGAASSASNSVTPIGDQTITFANPGAQGFGTTPTLTATASSGLSVSFSSSTTAVCTITSGGSLTFLSTGTCSIDADQAGNSAFNPAPTVSQSFAVNAGAPSAPTIGSATAGDASASVSFAAPASTGGSAITGYTVTSSPGGLTGTGTASPITVSGLTNGTAYTFSVTATNSAGTGAASAASNSVTPIGVPSVGAVSATVPYNASATAIPLAITGSSVTSINVVSGPSHGTVQISGITLSYTPATSFNGTDSFTYTATNASGTSSAASVSVTVSAPTITVSPTSPSGAVLGTAYSTSFSASGGTGPYSFATTPASGSLPPGLSLSSAGVLSGTPTQAGSFTVTLSGTDTSTPPTSFTSAAITILVAQGAPAISAISPTTGSAAGGTSVTISGSQLAGVTSVSFGGTAATSFTVESDSQITAIAPAGSGVRHISVTSPGGSSASTGADQFTYLSDVATLSGLSLSTGALSPSFNAGISAYSVALPAGTTALRVTPTTTDSAASVSVNGSVVASGSPSAALALTPGANTISLLVTAQDGTAQQSYAITATVALQSDLITFSPIGTQSLGGAPVAVTASAASGLPVTLTSATPAICTLSGGLLSTVAAGTCQISGSTEGNAQYAPASATLSVLVSTLPDPSKDPDVIGIVTVQNSMAMEFGRTQMQNFSSHLEALRDGDGPRDSFGASLALPALRPTPSETATLFPSARDGAASGQQSRRNPGQTRTASAERLTATASTSGMDPTLTSSPNLLGPRIGLWTAGSLSLETDGDLDVHTNGLSAGIDYQLSERAIIGFGLGIGYGHSDIGDDGSNSKGRSKNAVVYGTFKAGERGFVDVLAGYGKLNFDTERAISGGPDMAYGSRSGDQIIGQIRAGLEYRADNWMLSPYAGMRVITGHLDAYSERADNPSDALHFDRQGYGTSQIDLGVRGSIKQETSYGSVSPNFRLEYHRVFNRDVAAGMSYANLSSGGQYILNLPQSGEDLLTIGLGANFDFDNGTNLRLDYRNTSGSGSHSQSLALQYSMQF